MGEQVIEKSWMSFVKACQIEDAPEIQLKEMRNAFYGGAVSVFSAVVNVPDDEDEAHKIFDSIQFEIENFNEKLKH